MKAYCNGLISILKIFMDELLSQTLAVREFRIVRKEIGKLLSFWYRSN